MVSVKHVADPDPKGGIGIQLNQYIGSVESLLFFLYGTRFAFNCTPDARE